MEKNKYSKILTASLVVIIIGILGTLGYFGYSLLNENNTKKKYTDAAEQFEQKVLGGSSSVSNGANVSNIVINTLNRTGSGNRDKEYMEDFEIIGTIEIPKTKLKCAILNETAPRSLELAVTVMYPINSDVNVPGRNVIIYGHNYRNSLFFSKNGQLVNGDKIYILDREGKKVTYEVFETFETTSTDTTFYTDVKDENKCEITLSTCTDDASSTDRRLIVQAREK